MGDGEVCTCCSYSPQKRLKTIWLLSYSINTGEGNGNPLQYSCLENPMDRGAWWAIVHDREEPDTTEQLTHMYIIINEIHFKERRYREQFL